MRILFSWLAQALTFRHAKNSFPPSGKPTAQVLERTPRLIHWIFTLLFMAVLVTALIAIIFADLGLFGAGALVALTLGFGAPILNFWFNSSAGGQK